MREKNWWTQDELAEKLYIRRQSISKWEIVKTCPNSENFKCFRRYLMYINISLISDLLLGSLIIDQIKKEEGEMMKKGIIKTFAFCINHITSIWIN